MNFWTLLTIYWKKQFLCLKIAVKLMFPLGCQKIGQKIPKKRTFWLKIAVFWWPIISARWPILSADIIGQHYRYYRPIYRYRSFTTDKRPFWSISKYKQFHHKTRNEWRRTCKQQSVGIWQTWSTYFKIREWGSYLCHPCNNLFHQ